MAEYYGVEEIDAAYVQDGGVYDSAAEETLDATAFASVYTQVGAAYSYSDSAESITDESDQIVAASGYSDSTESEPAPAAYSTSSYSDESDSYNSNSTPSAYTTQTEGSESSGYSDQSSYQQLTNPRKGQETPHVDSGFTFARASQPPVPPQPASEFSFGKPRNLPEEPKIAPVKEELYKQKNWNREFQELLTRADSEEKYAALSRLANEFVFVAETYGKVIISELSVPPEEKTVRPVSIGGIAGGEKYIVQGILFKFALDISGIYGGDENAMKAAGHELIGLSNLYFTAVAGLHFPLMCLIRYCGFCLVAMSILPIGKDTLMYGSSDGGKTVHFDDPELTRRMEEAGLKLNLKPHFAGNNLEHRIVGPGDIEGHRSREGDYYVVDFARVFPPEAALPTDPKEPGRILYKLLRPELVSRNRVPLSSDALTGWGRNDPDAKLHNREVLDATQTLLLEIIPRFVKTLIDPNERVNIVENAHSSDLLTGKRMGTVFGKLFAAVKQRGINMRHVGLIRNLLATTSVEGLDDTSQVAVLAISRVFLVEIFARVLKSIVQEQWRKSVRSHYHINQEMCKEQALDVLNCFLDFKSPQSISFWCNEGKQRLLTKYRGALTAAEAHPEFDPRKLLIMPAMVAVIQRFQHSTGFRLTEAALNDLARGTSSYYSLDSVDVELFKFLRCDAATIDAKIKHTNIVDFADIQSLLLGGIQQSDQNSSNRYFVLVLSAVRKSPHMALMGARQILDICSTLAHKVKNDTQIARDVLASTVVSLVQELMIAADELSLNLRLPILVKAGALFRRLYGSDAALQDLESRLKAILEHDPRNFTALMALMKIYVRTSNPEMESTLQKLMALAPHDPRLNMNMANYSLNSLAKHLSSEKVEEIMSKLLAYFSMAAQTDPAIVSKAKYGTWPLVQEAQLRMAAAVPTYRPSLRQFYSSTQKLVLKEPAVGGSDGLLIPISSGECAISFVKAIKCLGLSDVGLARLVTNLVPHLTHFDVRGSAAASSKTAASLKECQNLVAMKFSSTSINAADALSVILHRSQFETFHVDAVADFDDASLATIAELPFAPQLRSIAFGATAVTAASVPTISKFASLSKLFLRGTSLPWETCADLLRNSPTVSTFSVEGATAFQDADILQHLTSLNHPSLEIFVAPSNSELMFSGPFKVTVNLVHNSMMGAFRIERSDPAVQGFSPPISSNNKRTKRFPSLTVHHQTVGQRVCSFSFPQSPTSNFGMFDNGTSAAIRKFAISPLSRSGAPTATPTTIDFHTQARSFSITIPGMNKLTFMLTPGHGITTAKLLGMEFRISHTTSMAFIPPNANVSWALCMLYCLTTAIRKM